MYMRALLCHITHLGLLQVELLLFLLLFNRLGSQPLSLQQGLRPWSRRSVAAHHISSISWLGCFVGAR